MSDVVAAELTMDKTLQTLRPATKRHFLSLRKKIDALEAKGAIDKGTAQTLRQDVSLAKNQLSLGALRMSIGAGAVLAPGSVTTDKK